MEKVALVLCYYGKQSTASAGKWPAPVAVPPEMCNQATGQLWGIMGGWGGGVYFQIARDNIFTFFF